MVERVHHIDFVVHDLDAATARYTRILGVTPHAREGLEERGVEVVRFEVGDVWIALVQPVSRESPVQAFLDRHGEGFYHIAFKVRQIEAEAARLEGAGIRLLNRTPRRGLEGWKLIDIDSDETFGASIQLVEESRG